MLRILRLIGGFYYAYMWKFAQYYETNVFDGGQENIVGGRMWGSEGYFLNKLCSKINGNLSLSSGFFFKSFDISWLTYGVVTLLKQRSFEFLVNGFTP